ncbi:glycoside hydrolase family 13 protein, partial [Bacteroidota bacterium]
FANGDTANDPKAIDMAGGWPYFVADDWHVSNWTGDWYALQEWEKNSELDFYGNTGTRRYGGDIQGIISKLDYLKDLGITALYLNPIFESPSLHKYDAAMYHHIDNNFGPDPDGDRKIWATENPIDPSTWNWTAADKLFLELIEECHKRDMKIIIDGVFNHTGTQFWAFKDVVENQQNSSYKDWFIINEWDDPNTEENEFSYKGWLGVRDLPEIREDENGLVTGPKEHIHVVIKRWMDPNNDGDTSDGIDGWRLDVAEMVQINFWKEFRSWVKSINPDAYLTGEVWWEDWNNNVMFNASEWLQGDAFDAVMNYRFTRAVKKFVNDIKDKITPQGFIDSLNTQYGDYDKDNLYVLMNLMGSHDTERLATMTVNPDIWYDHNAIVRPENDFKIRKPNDVERMRQKLMVGIQMTMPGAPMVYYGDEAGMWGGDDPNCRKPMVWPEFTYDDETTHPFGKTRPKDVVKFDDDLFNWYKKVISVRNVNQCLSLGDINFFLADESNSILGYSRTYGEDTIFVMINNNNEPSNFELELSKLTERSGSLTDLITGDIIEPGNSVYSFSLKPYQMYILH